MNLGPSWDYIIAIARKRLSHNKTSRHVTKYGDSIELLGVAGEIVARRYLGMDDCVHEEFDGGIDFEFYGMKVDVKATVLTPKIEHRFLQWPAWKWVKADIVLMTAIDPINRIGTVIGYATRQEIIDAPINAGRFDPCHEIPVSELHPAWKLVAEACK